MAPERIMLPSAMGKYAYVSTANKKTHPSNFAWALRNLELLKDGDSNGRSARII